MLGHVPEGTWRTPVIMEDGAAYAISEKTRNYPGQ